MGALGQLALLLRKNWTLRLRSPALTITQLLWPVLLFVVIALVRSNFKPESKPNCYYDAKAMPSQGLVPFTQSFMCDLSTSCQENATARNGNDLPSYHSSARVATLASGLGTVFSDNETVESFMKLPEAIKPLADLTDKFDSEKLANFTDKVYLITDFFHNVSDVRRYLVEAGLDGGIVDSVLRAKIDVYQLLEVIGYVDFKGIVCNSTRLAEVLTFPDGVSVETVSKDLCGIRDDKISDIVEELQVHLDLPYLINEFAEFLRALGETDWSVLLQDASQFITQLEGIADLGDFVEGLPSLLEIVKLVPTLQELAVQLEQGTLQKQLDVVVKVMYSLDAQLSNVSWWTDMTNFVSVAQDLIPLITRYYDYYQDNIILFGSIIKEPAEVQAILVEEFGLTSEDVQAILQLQLKLDKLPELLEIASTTADPVSLFCSPGKLNITDFLHFPQTGRPTNLQDLLCKVDSKGNHLLDVLMNSTNVLQLIEELNSISIQKPSDVQWEVIVSDLMEMVESLRRLPDFLQDVPALLESFGRLVESMAEQSVPAMDWTQMLLGTLPANMTVETAVEMIGSEAYASVIQGVLSQTPIWPEIQHQLISQNMMADINLDILKIFSTPSCPDGWHSHGASCYKYVLDNSADFFEAESNCQKFHPLGHLVQVNHELEQQFIESIGENSLSWIGLFAYSPSVAIWYGDWTVVSYDNWISGFPTNGTFLSCAKANFGQDGLWHHADCSSPSDSYVCESPDNGLLQLLKDEPTNEIIDVLLELGPNVTEVILHLFLNESYIETLVQMAPEDQGRVLCTIDLSTLQSTEDVAVIRQKLCSLNLTRIFSDQIEYWQIPYLEAKVREYLAFMDIKPTEIPAEYLHLANLSALICKHNAASEGWAEVFARPLNLELVFRGFEDTIRGQSQDWEEMFLRVLARRGESMPQSPQTGQSSDLSLQMLKLQLPEILKLLDFSLGMEIFQSTEELWRSLLGMIESSHVPGQTVSLASLFPNETFFLEFFQSQLDLTSEDLQTLQLALINIEQIPQIADQLMASAEDVAMALCLYNMSHLITFPEGTTTDVVWLAESLHRLVCSLSSGGDVMTTLLEQVDLAGAVPKPGNASGSDRGNLEDLNRLLESFVNATLEAQDFPSIVEMIPHALRLLSADLGSILWQSNMTLEEFLSHFMYGSLPVLVEKYLAMTEIWPMVQQQMISQNLMLDLQISVLRLFSGGECPAGWHTRDISCYRYVDEAVLGLSAYLRCLEIKAGSNLVTIDNWQEQLFLQSIGENSESWINRYTDGIYGLWGSGLEVPYSNWSSWEQSGNFSCAKTNFGLDGAWYSANCSEPLDSFICEAIQDHILVKRLQEQPFQNVTNTLLELGPNVTEAVVLAFLDPAKLLMFLNMSESEMATVLCREDFVILQPSDVDARQALCRLNLTAIFLQEMEHWNVPEIEAKLNKIQEFFTIWSMHHDAPSYVPEEFAPYASLSKYAENNRLFQELLDDATRRPFNPAALFEGMDTVIAGTDAEWLEMANRVSAKLNQEQSTFWLTLAGSDMDTTYLMYNELGTLLMDSGIKTFNKIFHIVQEFSAGRVFSDAMPEMERFLQGIMGLIDDGHDLALAVSDAWTGPSQLTELFATVDMQTFFCNSAVRQMWLGNSAPNTTALDNYLCLVNFDLLGQELLSLTTLDEIINVITLPSERLPVVVPTSNLTVSVEELTMNVNVMIQNAAALPYLLPSFEQRYNLTSLAAVGEALLASLLQDYNAMVPMNGSSEMQMESISQYIQYMTGLEGNLFMLAAAGVVDLQQVHAYVDFMNRYMDQAKENSCREGWQFYDDSCYRPTSESGTYWDAYFGCLALDADVVSVGSDKEQTFLEQIGPDADTWVFSWSHFQYENFASYEPERIPECVKANFGADGLWYYVNCSDNYQYICEAKPEINITLRLLVPFINDSSTVNVINILEQSLSMETVDTILSSPLNPLQLTRLVLGMDWQGVMCDEASLRALFMFPESVNVTQLRQAICGQAFMESLASLQNNSDIFGQFLSQIASFQGGQFNSSAFVGDVQLLVEHLVSLEKYQVYSYVPHDVNPLSFLGPPDWTSWEQTWSIPSILTSLDTLEQALSAEPTLRELILTTRALSYFIEYYSDKILSLQGNLLVVPELRNLFANITETERLLETVAGFSPEMIEAVMGLLAEEEKLEELLTLSDPFGTLCAAGNFSAYLSMPYSASIDIAALEGALCSLDFAQVSLELRELLMVDSLMMKFQSYLNSTSMDNLSQSVSAFLALYERTGTFLQDPLSVGINQTWLNETLSEVVKVLEYWGMRESSMQMLSSQDTSILSGLYSLDTAFNGQPWWSEFKESVRQMITIIEYGDTKIQSLPDKNITFFDVFPPATAKLLQMSLEDFPEILAVLSQSYVNVTWLNSMAGPNDLVNSICDQAAGRTELIAFAPGVNASAVHAVLCSLDLTQLTNEWSLELAPVLARLESNVSSLNWTSAYASVTSLVQTLTTLSQSPPSVAVYNADWLARKLHELDIIMATLYPLDEIMTGFGFDNILLLLDTASAEMGGVYDEVVLQLRLEDYINMLLIDQISLVMEHDWTLPTLEGLFLDADNVRRLLSLWDLSPDIIDAFLTLSIQPEQWPAFWEFPDPFAALCLTDQFAAFFATPLSDSQSNLTAVQQAVCSVNLTALELEIAPYFDVVRIQRDLAQILSGGPGLPPFNLTAWIENRNRLSAVIEQLVVAPATVAIDLEWRDQTAVRVQDILENWLIRLEAMGTADPVNSTQEVLQGLVPLLQSMGVLDTIGPYLELCRLSLESITKQVQSQGPTVMGQLHSSTALESLVPSLSVIPEQLEVSLSQSFFDVFLLASIHNQPGAWQVVFCNSTNFHAKFHLHPIVNATAVQQAMCVMNRTEYFMHAADMYGVDILRLQPQIYVIFGLPGWTSKETIDMEYLTAFIEDIQGLVMDLQAVPSSMMGDVMHNVSYTLEIFLIEIEQRNIMAARQVLAEIRPYFIDDTILAEIERNIQAYMNASAALDNITPLLSLEMFEAQLRELNLWKEVKPFIDFADVILEGINMESHPGGEPIPEFLYNRTVLERFLREVSDRVYPAIDQYQLGAYYHISLLAYLHLSDTWEEEFCLPRGFDAEYEALRARLCQADRAEVFRMLDAATGVDVLRLFQSLFVLQNHLPPANVTNQPYDWNTMISNVESIVASLQGALRLPWLPGNHGNMEETAILLQELQASVVNASLMLTIENLEKLDVLLSDEGFWSAIQGYVTTTTNIVQLLNQQIEILTAADQTIEGAFHSEVPEILSQFLAPEHVQSLMEASVNPELIGLLTDPNALTSVLCDTPARFSQYVVLPPGSDVATIQGTLCGLAMANETFLRDLMSAFNIGLIQEQVQNLLLGNVTSPVSPDWQRSVEEFERLIANALTPSSGQDFLGDFFSRWLVLSAPTDALAQSFMEPPTYNDICQSMLNSLVETYEWHAVLSPVLASSNLAVEIVQELVFTLPTHQKELEAVLSNMTAVVELLTVTTEIQQVFAESAPSVFFDPEKLNSAIQLTLQILEGRLPEQLVCDEEMLSEITGNPYNRSLSDLSQLLCGIEKLVQTQAVQEVLQIVGFNQVLPKIMALFTGDPAYHQPFDCQSMVANMHDFVVSLPKVAPEFSHFLNSFETPEYFDLLDALPQILSNTSTEDIQSLTDLYHLLEPIGHLLGNSNQGSSSNLEMLLPYLGLIDTSLIKQLEGTELIETSTLWLNSMEVRLYLSAIEGFSPMVIDAVIYNQLNVSALSQLQGDTVEQLCHNKTLFSQLFVFDESTNASEVQRILCTSLNSTDIFEFLTDSINITELFSSIGTASLMAVSLPEYLNELIAALESFSALDPELVESLNTEQWPMIADGFINSTEIVELGLSVAELITIGKSLQPIVEFLQPILKEDPNFQMIQELFASLDNFDGFLNLVEKLPDLSLQRLFRDSKEFQAFLVDGVGLSEQVAEDILSASLSFEVAASADFSDVNAIVCDEESLTEFLEFPAGTNVTHVLETLCHLSSEELSVILDGVVPRLNIGTLIEELLTYTLVETLGDGSASSLEDLERAASDLKPIRESMRMVSEQLQSTDVGSLEINAVVESLMGNAAAQQAASTGSLSSFLCGEGSAITFPSSEDLRRRRRRRSTDLSRTRRDQAFDIIPGSTPFCNSIYESIQSSEDGNLVWHYIKPVLLGKITYAPNNEVTAKIIKESNFMFEEISTIRSMAMAWRAGSKDMKKLLNSSQQLDMIEKFLSSPYTGEILEDKLGLDADLLASLLGIEDLANSVEDLDQLDKMAELMVNLTDCIDLDRFVPAKTEGSLESLSRRYARNNTLFAGVYFSNMSGASVLPSHVHYKIRMDAKNTPATDQVKSATWVAGANNDLLNQLYSRGFVFLQDMIEKGIIQAQTESNVQTPGVYVQLMPYPCHVVDEFVERFSYMLPLVLTFVFLGVISSMTYQIVYEKELGIEELMKSMGLRGGLNLFSWFLNSFVFLVVICIILVIFLKVGNILPSSDGLLLFVFLLCFSLSLIMMCYLISTLFQTAYIAALASILVYLMTYIPYVLCIALGGDLESHQKAALSLFSTFAFTLGCNEIALKEAETVGVQWDDFRDGFHNIRGFGFTWLCMSMLWDSLLYFVLGCYISAIYPGRHGVPKPWYFVFLPWYWSSCCSFGTAGSTDSKPILNKNPDVESDPTNLPLGISVLGLTKKYGKKKALDNLTLNFYEDQITSFLGQNGAGKTTTISIIMGLFPGFSGRVHIYGKDVMQRLHSMRKELGVCPQHDALYDQLTVREHLELFGRLKGMSLKDIFQQSKELIADVGLQGVANEKVCTLSGGMKRKLCVMIAFLGGSNIVILDEPTSGVDPHARRGIWDLIVKHKKGRTILLCTHFMDEADLLGDRIAVLEKGQLRCCGSSAFLKNRFCDGYTLTVAKATPGVTAAQPADGDGNLNGAVPNVYTNFESLRADGMMDDEPGLPSHPKPAPEGNFSVNKLTSFIQSHIPSAVLKEDVGTEVSYTLPSSFEQTSKFQALFEDLDDNLAEFGASSYGIADATLEEAFLKVSTSSDRGSTDDTKNLTKTIPESTLNQTKFNYEMKPTAWRQFWAIITKRFHYAKRDWWGLIWGLILPVVWLLLAIAFTSVQTRPTYMPLHFAPSAYGPGDYVFFSNSDSDTSAGEMMTNSLFSEPGLGTACMADFPNSASSCHFTEPFFSQPLSELSKVEIQDILETDRNAPDCNCAQKFLECPDGAAGSHPPEWTMNTTDILLDASLKVDLTDYLLKSTESFRRRRYNGLTLHSIKNSEGITEDVVKAWYNNKGYHAMPISLNMANNMLLRSVLSSDQKPAEFGISAYNHPFHFSEKQISIMDLWDEAASNFGICMIMLVAFSLIPATFAMFPVLENTNGSKRLHYISGVRPFGYWMANLVWDMLMFLIPLGISVIIVLGFGLQAYASATNLPAYVLLIVLYAFAIVCQLYILVPLFKTTGTAFIIFFCMTFLVALLTIFPKFLQESPLGRDYSEHNAFWYVDKVFLIFSPYCLACGLIDLLYNQAQADIFVNFGVDTYLDPFGADMLGWKLVALGIEGAIAFAVLLLIEYKCRYVCADCQSGVESYPGKMDEDVTTEKERVASGNARNDLVCIKNLSKVYKTSDNSDLVAVDNLSLGVPRGECFGLLGVNGAGKTSTFRMMIKDLIPTQGSIRVNSKRIGYCPQVNAVYDPLTGAELLTCYAKIKGISRKQCKLAVQSVSAEMGMQKYVHNCIKTYSGGMKRSLSTAIALLGNPDIVLLDEPTTGMDPLTKQAVWCSILALIKNGHSVVLTSHSMEECELLCTRLAIMVNGQFSCLGSPQHVKHRHGDGYTLILRTNDDAQSLTSAVNFIRNTFPDALLKERHSNMVQYQLPKTTRKLADIFGTIEAEKARLGIQEYSVTQTTLDQVFVNFAKVQTDGHTTSHHQENGQDFINRAFEVDKNDVDLRFV